MKGKIVVISVLGFVIFLIMFAFIQFATLMFSFSFGREPDWYVHIIPFFRNYPMKLFISDIEIWSVVTNTFVWTLIMSLMTYYISSKFVRD